MEAEASTKLEKAAFTLFNQNVSLYEPLQILSYKTNTKEFNSKAYSPDAYLTLAWKGQRYKFNVEVTGNLYLEAKLAQLKQQIQNNNELMIIVPYLTKGISEIVKEQQISCIDLSGNYYIQREELLAIRLDQPDQNKRLSNIRKAYAGYSSILGRLLLSEDLPKLSSLAVIRSSLQTRGKPISFSLISKVLTEMERDQIILKEEEGLKLLQPRKLLERLTEQYKPPTISMILRLKCPEDPINWLSKNKIQIGTWIRTGENSVNRYSPTVPPAVVSVYLPSMPVGELPIDDRFFNLILNVTNDDFVFFDYKEDKDIKEVWASQIQTYLELSQMDKREKEIAETIKTAILSKYE